MFYYYIFLVLRLSFELKVYNHKENDLSKIDRPYIAVKLCNIKPNIMTHKKKKRSQKKGTKLLLGNTSNKS